MKLADLPTPCLVLDRRVLTRNIAMMADALARHGVPLRPHMKTAKSIDVARLALAGQPGGITVSTLAEAAYFAAHGITDIFLAAGITPQKLDAVAGIKANVTVITDDLDMAAAIGAHPARIPALIEVDTGEHRGGVAPDSEALPKLAEMLGATLRGVLTHAGHSYAGRTIAEMAAFAEAERAGITQAADRLRAAGHRMDIVSMGSSPTALHAASLAGVTEVRAGVYMFGDLFQAAICTHGLDDIAVTVLTSVIGRRPAENSVLVDAGGIALSKDRSTAAVAKDYGFGRVLNIYGLPTLGDAIVTRTYQEHGVVQLDTKIVPPIGAKLRIAPNHTCLTVAQHTRYHVVDGGDDVVEVWDRVNGW